MGLSAARHPIQVPVVVGANSLLDDDKATERFVGFIRPCPRQAEEKGMALLIENLFDVVPLEIPNSFRSGYRSSEATRSAWGCLEPFHAIDSPYFRYNYDAGHFLCGGEEPYRPASELPKDYIRNMHFRDTVEYDRGLHGLLDEVYPQRDRRGDHMRVPVGSRAASDDAPIDRRKKDGHQGSVILEPHRRLDNAIMESPAYFAPAYLAGHGHSARRSTGAP
jgi:sugar phosphate isomerase/epimerase